MKDENGKMTTGCLRCAVLMSLPKSFIDASTAPGESIHHDTLNVLGALLYSAGESRKHVRFRKDDFPLRLENLELADTVWCDASGTKEQVAKWRFGIEEQKKICFLSHLHDAVFSSDIARRLSWMPRTCLAEERESTSPPCSIYISLRLLSFRALAGDACVMAMLLGECTCSSDPSSSVPSIVLTLYADAIGHGTFASVTQGLSKRVFSCRFMPRLL